MSRNILITFVGNRDPYVEEAFDGLHSDGPILTLLKDHQYHGIHLLSNRTTLLQTQQIMREIRVRQSWVQLQEHFLELSDPTSYGELIPLIWNKTVEIQEKYSPEIYFDIATSSGTPQMHATWVLLHLSKRIRGRLLRITPPKFLKHGEQAVSVITGLMEKLEGIPAPFQVPDECALLRARNRSLQETLDGVRGYAEFDHIIGFAGTLREVLESVRRIASESFPVLINGESGTGKELIARALHQASTRAAGPFITVNCGGIPDGMVESILFGHKKGAFTGAVKDNLGRIAEADGGTLFLDEIGDIPLSQQVKLLRFLQEGEVDVLGGAKKQVDVRVVAATHRDLAAGVSAGHFREDLFYRLTFPLHLPPLRDRRQDIPAFVEYFLQRRNEGRSNTKRISAAALLLLQNAPWPGNVRELENIITRMYFGTNGSVITPESIPADYCSVADGDRNHVVIPTGGIELRQVLADLEKAYFKEALQRSDNNKAQAARLLGLAPKAFQKACRERFKL